MANAEHYRASPHELLHSADLMHNMYTNELGTKFCEFKLLDLNELQIRASTRTYDTHTQTHTHESLTNSLVWDLLRLAQITWQYMYMYDGCYAMQLLCSVIMWSWVWWTVPHECVKWVIPTAGSCPSPAPPSWGHVCTKHRDKYTQTDKIDVHTFSVAPIIPYM